MKKILRSLLAFLAAGTFCGFFSTQLSAQPIVGDIDFSGVVTFDTMSLATVTRVNVWNTSFVSQDSGDFATFVTPGTNSTMATPWIFSPSTPTPELWKVGGFTFDLTSSVVVSRNNNLLNITGVGMVSGNGFDTTPGTWSFTSSRADGQNAASFSFQGNSAAVPEAGTTLFLVTGALGFAGLRFLRKTGSKNNERQANPLPSS